MDRYRRIDGRAGILHAKRSGPGGAIPLALWGIAVALLIPLACDSPSEPRDTTPPPVPDATLITASIPAASISTVRGEAGAVEPSAWVIVRNPQAGAADSTVASEAGAFVRTIPATVGDFLIITARDAAGNTSEELRIAAGVPREAIRIAIVSGDGQTGVQGQPLTDPLVVRVTADGQPIQGAPVHFQEEALDGPGGPEFRTAADGTARTTWTLGQLLGLEQIRSIVFEGGGNHEVLFDAEVVGPPEIVTLDPTDVAPGDLVTIEGRNFSPIAHHNVVTIGGRSVQPRSSTRQSIEVAVPLDLPGPTADVVVTLTGVSSAAAQLEIVVLSVAPPPIGQVDFRVEPTGTGTVTLPFATSRETYLVSIESTRQFPAFFLGLAANVPLSLAPIGGERELAAAGTAQEEPDGEAKIREEGYELLLRHGPPPARAPAPLQPAAQSRTFFVLNSKESRFESRTADLLFDGDHVIIYVDQGTPASFVTAADAVTLGRFFDDDVYDDVRRTYGSESDFDGNGKVIVLLTPIVNEQVGDVGRVFGFFNPADLSASNFSNRGEIFYLLVPDPLAIFERATPDKDVVFAAHRGTVAHEFVHMIEANERPIVRGLTPLPSWLAEGIAHAGEFVIGEPLTSNAMLYLNEKSFEVPLLGAPNLTNRGASTLFVLDLVESEGIGVLRRIVTAFGAGTGVVENATGQGFGILFHRWALSIFNAIYPIPGVLEGFVSTDLRSLYQGRFGTILNDPPLKPIRNPIQNLTGFVVMPGSAVAHLLVSSDQPRVVGELRFDGPSGAGIQVSVVRVE